MSAWHQTRLTRRSLLAGSGAALIAAPAVRAQAFPSAPVKIITSVGAGAAPDVISRLVADHLTRLWGQQVIILNRPGGAGAVAIKAVATEPPDGHTLYMALASNFIALPELQKNFPVDVLHDLVPIGFVGEQPLMIALAPSLGVNTLTELIELFKKRPNELNIGAGSRGSILHFAGEWLRSATNTQFAMLHYPGGAQAIPDVLGGRLQAMIDAIAGIHGAIVGGQLKPLAVTSKQRPDNFAQVPTVAETIPGFEAMGWMALMAPPKTPEPIAKKISDDLKIVMAKPELKSRLDDLGNYPHPMSPTELVQFIEEQRRIWGPIIAKTAKTL